jgi:dTDP-4-amino-4,6-dideoxyglucose
VLSFHATKIVNSFEGGAVTTRDRRLAARLRALRDHGGGELVEIAGTNGKLSEAAAAMGLTNLESLPRFLEANRVNHEAYRDGLAGIAGIRLLEPDARERHNHHYVVVDVGPRAGLERDQLLRALHAERVLARRYFSPPCHRMPPFAGRAWSLPRTERASAGVLCLPTGTAVAADDARRVCALVREALARAGEVREALR